MMIEYTKANIFTSDAEVLVNPVNTVGVMGKGLALEFKKRYPNMFVMYQQMCKQGLLIPGTLQICDAEQINSDKSIINFPTKNHWREQSKLEYIENGLYNFRQLKLNYDSYSFPQLGCGNGGLRWTDVEYLMLKYLSDLPYNIYLHITTP